MEGYLRSCVCVSLMGVLFLVLSTQSGLGVMLEADYKFLPIHDRKSAGYTAFVGAGIYGVFLIVCFFVLLRLRKRPDFVVFEDDEHLSHRSGVKI